MRQILAVSLPAVLALLPFNSESALDRPATQAPAAVTAPADDPREVIGVYCP